MIKRWEPQSELERDEVWMAVSEEGNWVRYGEYAILKAERDAALKAQSYTYIGKDGKSVLARDLEDQRDAAVASRDEFRRMWRAAVRDAEIAESERDVMEAELDEVINQLDSARHSIAVLEKCLAKLKGTEDE